MIPRLLDRARSGRLRRVGDGTNLIDMVYVENAARAHLLAADALVPSSRDVARAANAGRPIVMSHAGSHAGRALRGLAKSYIGANGNRSRASLKRLLGRAG